MAMPIIVRPMTATMPKREPDGDGPIAPRDPGCQFGDHFRWEAQVAEDGVAHRPDDISERVDPGQDAQPGGKPI